MQALATFALVLTLSAIVALPSYLAIVRKHPRWLPITIVNVLFGWTIVGWILALVWVVRPVKPRKPRVRKPAKARPAAAGKAAANDNASALAATPERMPDPLDADVYEDWLEHGGALEDADAAGEAAPTTAAASDGSASSPRAAA